MSTPGRDHSTSPMASTPRAPPVPTLPDPPPSLPTAASSLPSVSLPSHSSPPDDAASRPPPAPESDPPLDYLNGGPSTASGGLAPASYRQPAPARSLSPLRNTLCQEPDQGTAAPGEPVSPGRPSVQFAHADVLFDPPRQQSPHGSWDEGDLDARNNRSRSERWVSKLRSTLGSSAALQPPKFSSVSDHPAQPANASPVVGRSHRVPDTLDEEEGSDADVEASGDEDQNRDLPKSRRKRMRRRLRQLDVFTAPSSPRPMDDLDSPHPGRLNTMARRSTMPEAAEHRGGLSEGEGRDQLIGRRPNWARGSSWIGAQRTRNATAEDAESPQPRTPGHRRRISEMFGAGGMSDGDWLTTPKRPFLGADRAATFGVQRWKQVKNTLRMLGKRRTDQFDFYKSAELMAELRAVTPAVVILASMLQRDEHGNKRIPVLLEQLNLRVINSRPEDSTSERHTIFTIALEYGSGLSRMRWTVTRSVREIWNIHWKYKLSLKNDITLQATTNQRIRPKQPRFPRKAFPYLRTYQNLEESDEEEKPPGTRADDTVAEMTAGEATAAEGTASDNERRPNAYRKKSRINTFLPRRQSTGLAENGEVPPANSQNSALLKKKYIERQRKTLEKYLQEMVHWLMFRADSNRLCKFLELSALGVRLAAEGSFHGKECYLHIQSTNGIDFRRVLSPQKVIARHSRKWFLVRQHYIAVVESPSTMNIYDVYLVDPHFRVVSKKNKLRRFGAKLRVEAGKGKQNEGGHLTDEEFHEKHHTLKIYSVDRKIKLFSRNQTVLHQFEESVLDMLKQTQWHQSHRFDSFAPVRTAAFAQWLVDGRDYMWNVSRAISMAQDVIYIHDWWLSPELYMRRPACISQKWRLDRLLQRKAREGVKIFIIIYRNVEQAIPIDSEYTKFSLLNLHDNILVLRSPNQLKKNQFFYAHHEKVCIVDHDVAFLGGIDLCFGRWDNPQHPIADDRPTGMEPDGDSPRDAEHCQLFPGKDYSNPRVLDFFKLNEPYEEMYDRSKVPRMPWHDIAMQVVGQPARDLTRHFVQRWNYLRRERKPTRPTPFLLPPPDANPVDLEALGLSGTCEVQILRSAGDWSLGYPKDLREHSIQSAYVKMIEESEHFVYIENQFFITSTETMNTRVVNRIGDALVERIIRAHEKNEEWRCCIIIPLVPGFQNTVDQAEGSSVRLIMQFQYRSICRGPNSIFGRLQAAGIEPEDYIQFFSLRQWGRIGADNQIVTEQLYIHAKTIVVDDRVALIGSANINERSMLGNRDSEVAAIVRDTEMMWSTMGGKQYRVGRFAHTLRMRLMREHLGLDVDEITEEERQAEISADARFEAEMGNIYGDDDETPGGLGATSAGPSTYHRGASFNHDVAPGEDAGYTSSLSSSSASSNPSSSSKGKSLDRDSRVHDNEKHKRDVEGYGPDNWKAAQAMGLDLGSDSVVMNGHEVLLHRANRSQNHKDTKPGRTPREASAKGSSHRGLDKGNAQFPPPHPDLSVKPQLPYPGQPPALPVPDDADMSGAQGRPEDSTKSGNELPNPLLADIVPAKIDKDCMRDPVDPDFWENVWMRVAVNNTKLYRRVFRCMPDSEVSTWKEYAEFEDYARRFKESMGGSRNDESESAPTFSQGGPELSEKHAVDPAENNPKVLVSDGNALNEKASTLDGIHPIESGQSHFGPDSEKDRGKSSAEASSPVQPAGDVPFPSYDGLHDNAHLDIQNAGRDRKATFSSYEKSAPEPGSVTNPYNHNSTRRRRRATTKGSRRGAGIPYELLSREEAEELCGMIQGTVVQFPYDWLETEEKDNHWLYQADLLAPKEIYD
ncbi:phospholipase D [Durotheca rogersii]|uniref:phospholipase D n=1 Tax=Durotheca rogersii TaxID=419775 RepID=UPI002220D4D0|nr:phospholipase D [Durotheca rogersii]KAI5860889.1 phospholipase D [Durotheca rogersii]